jgi:hypothetical protein
MIPQSSATPMAGLNSNKSDVVIIRPFQVSDKTEVARIWTDGMEQSRSAVPWFLGSWLMNGMHHILSDLGDVGPNGKNMLEMYAGKYYRCMFVACVRGEPPVVVGWCAVKKGQKNRTVTLVRSGACPSTRSVEPC